MALSAQRLRERRFEPSPIKRERPLERWPGPRDRSVVSHDVNEIAATFNVAAGAIQDGNAAAGPRPRGDCVAGADDIDVEWSGFERPSQ